MARKPRLVIGTSGWSYPEWRRDFYAGVPQRKWLAHYASRFSGIEVNATFYRRQRFETYQRWHDETPPGFVFSVKGHRAVTHYRKLADVSASVAQMKEDLKPLGKKLAVVLWQLPPGLHRDDALIKGFLVHLNVWPETRHVLEFRHESWFCDQVAEGLENHRMGTVISDAANWPRWDRVTGGLAYIRLHGGMETYVSEYGDGGLRPWAERINAWRRSGNDVHVYFDNDIGGAAPRDAERLIAMLND